MMARSYGILRYLEGVFSQLLRRDVSGKEVGCKGWRNEA